ncbi:unnamed protein product [Gongylonema pulchrum]|uniref:Uncharacterized protein n=1 Tax=Gongylonema pulchrum TaxID=637853 RepID=A0A3P6P0B1_9BILA|nr:unnamed protein product [Gongylonema pulchrum]
MKSGRFRRYSDSDTGRYENCTTDYDEECITEQTYYTCCYCCECCECRPEALFMSNLTQKEREEFDSLRYNWTASIHDIMEGLKNWAHGKGQNIEVELTERLQNYTAANAEARHVVEGLQASEKVKNILQQIVDLHNDYGLSMIQQVYREQDIINKLRPRMQYKVKVGFRYFSSSSPQHANQLLRLTFGFLKRVMTKFDNLLYLSVIENLTVCISGLAADLLKPYKYHQIVRFVGFLGDKMRKIGIFWLILTAFVTGTLAFRQQSVGIRGKLMCGDEPIKGAKLKLINHNTVGNSFYYLEKDFIN